MVEQLHEKVLRNNKRLNIQAAMYKSIPIIKYEHQVQ